jgi:transglutaminase-like putative cysteine protease
MKAANLILIMVSTGVLAVTCPPAFSQGIPAKENIELGKKMKLNHPDDKVYCLNEKEEYSFATQRGSNQGYDVAVRKDSEKELISLKDGYTHYEREFYDSFSSVNIGKVYFKKGSSYSAVSPTINDHAYNQNGIFHDDSRLKTIKLDLTTLGNTYKYSLVKEFKDIRYFTTVHLLDVYPIAEKTVTFHVPDWLEIELKESNFDGFNIRKETLRNEKKKLTTYTYTIKNSAGIKAEDSSPSWTFTWPHILIIPKQFKASGKTIKIFNSVEDLYGWFSYLANQVDNKEVLLKPLVASILKEKKTDEEKIQALYYWVQDNIRYIAFEDGLAGYQPAPAYKVYENKYGDCKGMANLLKSMLHIAGYDARLTWIGTNNRIPYDFSVHNLAVANHAICTVILKDKTYYLDGTESYISLGDNADRIQGRQVLIEDKDKFILNYVPANNASRNMVEKKLYLSMKGNDLAGKAVYTYNGESKSNILREYHGLKSEVKEDFMKRFVDRYNKNLLVSNLKFSNLNDRNIPVQVNYDFTLSNALIRLENEMYLSLELDKAFEGLSLDSTRKSDFVFHEKVYRTSEIEFTVPNGYSVRHMPAPVVYKTASYVISLQYKQVGNTVKYHKIISVPEGVIKNNQIKEWNEVIAQLKKSYDDQLILIKK